MYKTLFNAVTDSLEELHMGEIVEAEYRLKMAQRECEHIFEDSEPEIQEHLPPNTIQIPVIKGKRKGK